MKKFDLADLFNPVDLRPEDWIKYEAGDPVPNEDLVDVKLFGGGVCIGADPKKLRWAKDFGDTPTCIVAWRKYVSGGN